MEQFSSPGEGGQRYGAEQQPAQEALASLVEQVGVDPTTAQSYAGAVGSLSERLGKELEADRDRFQAPSQPLEESEVELPLDTPGQPGAEQDRAAQDPPGLNWPYTEPPANPHPWGQYPWPSPSTSLPESTGGQTQEPKEIRHTPTGRFVLLPGEPVDKRPISPLPGTSGGDAAPRRVFPSKVKGTLPGAPESTQGAATPPADPYNLGEHRQNLEDDLPKLPEVGWAIGRTAVGAESRPAMGLQDLPTIPNPETEHSGDQPAQQTNTQQKQAPRGRLMKLFRRRGQRRK